eukprot:2308469-Lingulodinium_polyedra.AAC.1
MGRGAAWLRRPGGIAKPTGQDLPSTSMHLTLDANRSMALTAHAGTRKITAGSPLLAFAL